MPTVHFSKLTSGTDYMTDDLRFDINNEDTLIDISLINAIRRIIMADIKVPAIDKSSVVFKLNSSSMHNEMLSRRLEQIPIKTAYFETHEPSTTRFEFSKKNETEADMNILIREFKIEGEDDNSNIFVYPDSLFTTLKPGETVDVNGTFKISNSKTDGAVFNPASVSIYTFETDQAEVDKQASTIENVYERTDFMLQKADHYFKLNKLRKPAVYQYYLESVGQIPTVQLFRMGMVSLTDSLESLKGRLVEKRDVQIVNAEAKMDAVDFIIHDENETLGNLISTYHRLRKDQVKFCGYVIPHPEEKNLVIRCALNSDGPQVIEDHVKQLIITIDQVIELVKTLISEWDTVSNSVKPSVKPAAKPSVKPFEKPAAKPESTQPHVPVNETDAPAKPKKKRVTKKV